MDAKLPTIIDNKEPNTVLESLKKLLPESKRLDVATGFFEIGSLLSLDGFWNALEGMRIIMGDETQRRTRKELVENIKRESDESIEQSKERDDSLKGLFAVRQALQQGTISPKVYTRAKFHAKAMLMKMKPPHLSNYGIVGSSNFTEPGLCRNIELNLLTTEQHQLQALQAWYEECWNESEEVRDEILKVIEPHLKEYTPFEVYFKALYEYFRGKEVLTNQMWENHQSKVFPILSRYQKDGYHQALRIADEWGGVLLCDGVGLGKTFIGLMLLEYLITKEKKQVLLIVPKSARKSVWERFIAQVLEPHYPVEVRKLLTIHNHTDFGREGTIRQSELEFYNKYFGAIIIDEAHHFRTPSAFRTKQVASIAFNKQIFLLTATPVNNSLDDLYHLINLFAQNKQGHFGRIGIPSLRKHFNDLENRLQSLISGTNTHGQPALFDVQEEAFSSDVFRTDTLLKQVMIQRSRAYVKSIESLGDNRNLFPERQRPEVIDYSLKKVYASLFPNIKDLFESKEKRLSLAIYNPEQFKKRDASIDAKVLQYQQGVVGLIRTMLLKRLESSYKAFEGTLEDLLTRMSSFVEANNPKRFEAWRETNEKNWQIVKAHQSERVDEDTEEEEYVAELELLKLNPSEYEIPKLLDLVEADMAQIVRVLSGVYENLTPQLDDKIQQLVYVLKNEPRLKDQKLIIFTEFRDTARYLSKELVERHGFKDVEQIDSTRKGQFREEVIKRFAPYYNCTEEELPQYLKNQVRVLISTDVLSEGLNLQDANLLINYDLHWNPVRLMQRIGRVDRRIDHSKPVHHDKVYFYNFLPPKELNDLLHLFERVSGKVLRISKTLGMEAPLLRPDDPFEPIRLFNEAYDQTKSAEELMHEALAKLETEHPALHKLLATYPKRILSGKKGNPKGLFTSYRFPNLDPASKLPGEVQWYFYHYETKTILDDLERVFAILKTEQNEPRVLSSPTEQLSETRKQIETERVKPHLRQMQATQGAKAELVCWMEVD